MPPTTPRLRILSGALSRSRPCTACIFLRSFRVQPLHGRRAALQTQQHNRLNMDEQELTNTIYSRRQCCFCFPVMASFGHTGMRCHFGVEEWLRVRPPVRHLVQVCLQCLLFAQSPLMLTSRRSDKFGNERFKPRHGMHIIPDESSQPELN